jgi:hypothetical protein
MRLNSCWHCGPSEKDERQVVYPESTQLLGGYNCRLCEVCKNKWYRLLHADQSGLLADYDAAVSKSQAAVMVNDIPMMRVLWEAYRCAENELFALAEKFAPEPSEK